MQSYEKSEDLGLKQGTKTHRLVLYYNPPFIVKKALFLVIHLKEGYYGYVELA